MRLAVEPSDWKLKSHVARSSEPSVIPCCCDKSRQPHRTMTRWRSRYPTVRPRPLQGFELLPARRPPYCPRPKRQHGTAADRLGDLTNSFGRIQRCLRDARELCARLGDRKQIADWGVHDELHGPGDNCRQLRGVRRAGLIDEVEALLLEEALILRDPINFARRDLRRGERDGRGNSDFFSSALTRPAKADGAADADDRPLPSMKRAGA